MQATSPDCPTKKKGNVVDGTQFDTLVKRLSTTTLSRSTALRGLAGSVAAFAGVTLVVEPGAASQKKVCHCLDETVTSCETIKVGKRSARRHIRKHLCDYRGECQDFSGCCIEIGLGCTTPLSCCSGNCQGVCQACKSNGSICGSDSECCSKQCNVGNCAA